MNILITGGASGLGASIVKMLAREKEITIYFTYATSIEAAKLIEANYPNAKAVYCDFADAHSMKQLLELIPGMDLDVLINNANSNIHKEHFYKSDPDIFRKSFELNIMPTLQITQESIKVFRKKRSGKIINIISSAIINKPLIGLSAYIANKSYLLSMSKSWATEGIKFNITSNSISPSFMQTNLTSDTDERVIDQMNHEHPLKRLLTTDEVAEAVMFYVRASPHVNGTNLIINAGVDLS
jgi:3-oxoacyl-[acyl-carrier protein] reductase